MSRIQRWTQKVFASGASDIGIFGSGALGTKVLSSSLSDIQSLSAWTAGWLNATIGANKFPALEEVNAIDYLVTTQLAYLFQQGIPEYDSATTYYHYSMVMNPSTFQLFGSLVDNNTGNALPTAPNSNSNWEFLCDFSNLGSLIQNAYPVGSIYMNASSGTNPNSLLGFGTWAALGAGRVLMGVGTGNDGTNSLTVANGATGGEYKHTLTTTEMPSHTHTHTAADYQAEGSGGLTWAPLSSTQTTLATINATGGGTAHNNIQPYLAVYMWQRTA